jgi:hypothetical protein
VEDKSLLDKKPLPEVDPQVKHLHQAHKKGEKMEQMQVSNPERKPEDWDKEILEKDIDALTPIQLKRRLQLLEEKMAGLQMPVTTAMLEAGKSPAFLLPDDVVEIEMPLGPMGDVFKINETPYYGRCQVKLRTAQQLSSMVSNAYQIERERLQSRGSALDSAILRGEALVKIQRFNKIQAED